MFVPGAQGYQKASDPLDLELWMVMSHRGNAGKEQQLLLTTEPYFQAQLFAHINCRGQWVSMCLYVGVCVCMIISVTAPLHHAGCHLSFAVLSFLC